MKRSIKHIAYVALFAGLAVAWYGFGIEGARNVIRFWVYVSLACGVATLFAEPGKHLEPLPRITRWVTGVGDVAVVILFAWYGQFDYAAFWAFSSIAAAGYREKAERIQEVA
jgi:hypothetical protein